MAWGVSDRLDINHTDGSFKSFMVDDITSITYAKAPGATSQQGFSVMKVATAAGVTEFDLEQYPVFTYKNVDGEAFEIDHIDGEHASFVMLYNHNKPDDPNPIDPTKPYGWRGSAAGGPVFFLSKIEKGFDATYRVVGKYTGKEYTENPRFITISLGDDNKVYSIGVDCFTFTMPYEPVEMTLVTTERTTYVDRAFIGSYEGTRIVGGTRRLRVDPERTFTLRLKESGAYVVTDTDPTYNVEFADHYSVNDEETTFAFVPQEEKEQTTEFDEKINYGANGTFLGDGLVYIRIRDLIDGHPEATQYFFAGKDNYKFVSAADDDNAYKSIVEITPEGKSPRYWYVTEYGSQITEATANFKSGTTLADNSAIAIISFNGQEQIKYVNNGDGNPTFTYKGNEAGTYSDGSRTLILNGFGDGSLDGVDATYKIEGSVVTLTCNGNQYQFTIDTTNHTFAEETGDEWDGATHYNLANARGAYQTNPENTKNSIDVVLDHNLVGADKPGYASITVYINRNDGMGSLAAITGCEKYVYNAAKSTLTITNVYVGEGTTGYKRQNIVFIVSANKKSMWLDDSEFDRYYSLNRNGSYILTGPQNTLTTDEEIGGGGDSVSGRTFTAATKAKYMANYEVDADVKLAIDSDKNGEPAEGRATLYVTATIGSKYELVNDCVAYTFADSKLTLRDVTVGNGDMFSGLTKTTDIVFTLSNGVLKSDAVVYGNSAQTCNISLDFSEVELK